MALSSLPLAETCFPYGPQPISAFGITITKPWRKQLCLLMSSGLFKCFSPLLIRFTSLFVVLTILACSAAMSQRYTFRQYDTTDGLTDTTIYSLLQDTTGYIWVGTANGLFRYDGSHFRIFTHADGLPNTAVRGLAESPDGVLWVATQGGLARRRQNHFETVNTGSNALFRAVKFDGSGQMYLESSSGIVKGVRDTTGSYRFEMAAPGAVHGLTAHGGEVWFSRDDKVWRLKGNGLSRVDVTVGLPTEQWDYFAYDARGGLWVESATQLFELPSGAVRFVNRSAEVPSTSYSGLYADSNGRMFVAHASGVTMIDGNERMDIDERHGLAGSGVGAVLLDREGSLWLGVDGGGLTRRLGVGEWLSWKKEDGLLNNTIWSIASTQEGRIWAGSSGGLNLLDAQGKVLQGWTSHNGLAADEVLAIATGPGGNLFAGTLPGGISQFSSAGKLLKTYTASSGFTGRSVVAMSVDKDGRLWVASFRGCFRSRAPVTSGGTNITFEKVDIPGLGSNPLFFELVADKSGNVWIGSSSGLIRFADNRWRIFADRDGIKPGGVSVIALDRGALWLGYRDALGLTRFELNGEKVEATQFTVQEGLASDKVSAIVVDSAERLWVTSDVGVDVRKGERWRHYDRQDGLLWNDTDGLALHADTQGRVWVGTSAGLSRWAPPRYPLPDMPTPAAISAIEGGNGKLVHQWEINDRARLPFDQRTLMLSYSALSYSAESRVRFRYRVLGYDTTWTETQERSVRLAGLPAGQYKFQVVANGGNGLWSTSPAEFSFSIMPPWWQSRWIRTLSVLLVGLVIGALWHLRVRVLMVQKKRLEGLVAKRTADLSDSCRQLERIAYYDLLTDLPNRRMFNEKLSARLELARRSEECFPLLLIDLDNFKQINDTFGHDAGDAVLIETANRLKSVVRTTDCVVRLGGDEFAILIFSAYDPVAIEEICKRIVSQLASVIRFNDQELRVGASVGVAIFPDDGDDQTSLYKASDLALYKAKQTRSSYSFWSNGAEPDGSLSTLDSL